MKEWLRNAKNHPLTTLYGLATGAALGYAGYKSGSPELIIAGLGTAGFGASAKDAGGAK